jgi:hypothetical protein
MHMRLHHMSALTKLTADKTSRLTHTMRADEGRNLCARAVGALIVFYEGGATLATLRQRTRRRARRRRIVSWTRGISRWTALLACHCGPGGAFPQRLSAPAGSHWAGTDGVGASRSLNRLAPAWFHAQSLQQPTTHLPQRPCRLSQASNSFQQLGLDESQRPVNPGIRAPAVWE